MTTDHDDLYRYDEDFSDPDQYCEHGRFIGSWWGPDYLCGLCEAGATEIAIVKEVNYTMTITLPNGKSDTFRTNPTYSDPTRFFLSMAEHMDAGTKVTLTMEIHNVERWVTPEEAGLVPPRTRPMTDDDELI